MPRCCHPLGATLLLFIPTRQDEQVPWRPCPRDSPTMEWLFLGVPARGWAVGSLWASLQEGNPAPLGQQGCGDCQSPPAWDVHPVWGHPYPSTPAPGWETTYLCPALLSPCTLCPPWSQAGVLARDGSCWSGSPTAQQASPGFFMVTLSPAVSLSVSKCQRGGGRPSGDAARD